MECVICANTIPLGEGEEGQHNSADLRKEEDAEKWKWNFRCFAKLLGIAGQELRILEEEELPFKLPPTCGQCNAALNEVGQLEKMMEEMKVKQKALVEQLEGVLLFSGGVTNSSGELRKQLIACFLKLHPVVERGERRQTPIQNASTSGVQVDDLLNDVSKEEEETELECPEVLEASSDEEKEDPDRIEYRDELYSPAYKRRRMEHSFDGIDSEDDDDGDLPDESPISPERSFHDEDSLDHDPLSEEKIEVKVEEDVECHETLHISSGQEAQNDETVARSNPRKRKQCLTQLSVEPEETHCVEELPIAGLNESSSSDSEEDEDFHSTTSTSETMKPTVQRGTRGPYKKKNKKTNAKSVLRKVSEVDGFTQLSSDLLLYKFTVIRILLGNGFYCEEPGCFRKVASTWTTFDYPDALEEVKRHVNTTHYFSKFDYNSKHRSCPLCKEKKIKHAKMNGFSFRSHLRGTHGTNLYLCPSCGITFHKQSTSGFKAHVWRHKSEEEKATAAEVPARVTAYLKMRDEDKLRIWKCDECGKILADRSSLRAHKRRHLTSKPFHCEECGEHFSSKHHLREHIYATHRPELRRFRYCPICNQRFSWKGSGLKNHLARHQNVQSFFCEVCGKGFVLKRALRTHQKNVHEETTSKLYQCEFCEITYKKLTNLKLHQQKVHQDKVPLPQPKNHREPMIGPKIAFPCPVCERVFELRSRMTKHLKLAHSSSARAKPTANE